MVVRVLRDHSTIYQHRWKIGKMYKKNAPPKFDWFLSLKTIYFQEPIISLTLIMISLVLLFGYITYIFERELSDSKFSFLISLYVAFLCMCSGWPADPFGIYNVQTFPGMLAGVCCCLMGLVILAQLLDMLMSQITPTPHDRPAIMYVACYNKRRKLHDTAARLIQLIYRKHKGHVKLSEHQFFQQYMYLTRKFKLLKREFTSMEVYIAETETQATTKLFDTNSNIDV